jgi:hypothetical protein
MPRSIKSKPLKTGQELTYNVSDTSPDAYLKHQRFVDINGLMEDIKTESQNRKDRRRATEINKLGPVQ